MIKRNLGLTAFILTGLGIVVSASVKYKSLASTIFTLIMLCFFAIGIKDYIKYLKEMEIK